MYDSRHFFNSGIAKNNLEQYAEAIKDFDKAIELNPNDAAAYNNRGLAKKDLRQYAEAIQDYDKAIELNPNAAAYYNRGIVKNYLGQYAKAIKDFDKAIELNPNYACFYNYRSIAKENLVIELNPNDARAYYNRGFAKHNLKRYAEGIQDYDKAIELNPNYADAYSYRGLAKFNLKQYAEAIEDYDKAIELNPNDAAAYYSRGIRKNNLGQYAEAIKDYDKAIKLYPNEVCAYNNRGIAKKNLGQYVEAIKDYDKAIKLNPDYATGYSNRGNAKCDLKQYAEAIKDYDKAIKLNPDYATGYSNRGNAKCDLKQYAEAIKDFDKAIELNPNHAVTYNYRGHAKNKLGQHAQAIKDYDKVIELNPNEAAPYNNRGNAKYGLKQYAEAIKDYDKAIELNPNYADTYNNRGLAKNNLGQYAEAIKDFDKATELNPNDASVYNYRSIAKENLVIELNPNDADAYANRGIAKGNLRQYADAIKDYDKAIELNPNNTLFSNNRRLAKNKLEQKKLEKLLKNPQNIGDYLDTIWGRRQTPEQQPPYQVESAKVKGCAIGAFFKPQDKPDSVGWLGKLGLRSLTGDTAPQLAPQSLVRRGSALEAISEKIAADLYAHLSDGNFIVPKTRLAELPIKNTFTEKHGLTQVLYDEINLNRQPPIDDGVYVLSKRIEGYQDFAELKNCVLGEERLDFLKCLEKGKLPEEVVIEDKKIPIKGVMEILAASRLLADTDVLGGGASNAGFLIERNDNGDPVAVRAVKIDPGYAFNFSGGDNLFYTSWNPKASANNLLKKDRRHIQYGNQFNVIAWDNLTQTQQTQFTLALSAGLKALSNTQEIVSTFIARKSFEQTPKKRPLPPIKEYINDFEQYLKWQENTYAKELAQVNEQSRCLIQ
jgi:tetratricopeptide (TPR) repeat protein